MYRDKTCYDLFDQSHVKEVYPEYVHDESDDEEVQRIVGETKAEYLSAWLTYIWQFENGY